MSNILQHLISKHILPQDTLTTALSEAADHLTFHIPIQHVLQDIQKEYPHLDIQQSITSHHTQMPKHPSIKNIIAIASGKGGVGKSTATYFLAHALTHMGAKVGVLDADIYGPSQALMFDITSKPETNDQKNFLPFERQGIEIMSIGVLANSDKALMWRGPMISQALLQLYQKTQWGSLDYLLIDLPPGTGDISLTLLQKIPTTCGVLINYPHILAQMDVDRCKSLFNYLSTPVIGTILNMASWECPISPNTQPDLSVPFDQKFQDFKNTLHPEYIAIAQSLTQRLLALKHYQHNPFANIPVSKS